MARYIVVEFDRNEDAERFLKVMKKTTKKYDWMVRVVGVFVKPGRTCECPDAMYSNYRDPKKLKHQGRGIQMGEKFGWWVCSFCNKPRAGGHQLRNQLSMSETYEGTTRSDYEFGVTGLDVTGIYKAQIDRPKKLRRKSRG